MADEDEVQAKKKRTLLEKYDIPVNHLSFEYVKKCNNGKELERIVKILRSGEEGLYPDLQKCAEERLCEIMPKSKILQVEEPVLTRSMLDPEHWNQVNNDLQEWSSEMKSKEKELNSADHSLVTVDVPGIRSARVSKSSTTESNVNEQKKLKSVFPRDYSEWEKYDADKEILRMDMEEEKKKEARERKQTMNEKESLSNTQTSRTTIGGAGDFSSVEKKMYAVQEKDKGNECYKANEYKQAIEHYSASIELDPTPVAYNNRAMAHIKLYHFSEALLDSNMVLQMEPYNVKALHRRGIAYKELGSFENALSDFQKILELEPNNSSAISLAREVQIKIDSKRRTVRMEITEEDWGPKIEELPDEPFVPEPCIQDPEMKINTSWPAPPDRRIKCNKFGLPKVMCNCTGVPDWVRRPPPKCLICKEIKERRKLEQKRCKEKEQKQIREEQMEEGDKNKMDEKMASDSSESDFEYELVCEHQSDADANSESVSHSNHGEIQEVQMVESELSPSMYVQEEKLKEVHIEKGGGDSSSRDETSVSNEGTNKETISSPKVKSARKTETGYSLPSDSNKPVRVQVASKYTTKAISKGEEESAPGVQAIEGLSLEDSGVTKIQSPYEFTTTLQSLRKSKDPSELASLLKRVDPADLHTLIGNKLDYVMLGNIIECLEKSFIHDSSLVLRFMENLATLPRFGIVKCFLEPRISQVIEKLFGALEKQGCQPSEQLRQVYKL